MSETNGTVAKDPRIELRDVRLRNRLLAEQARSKRLERAARYEEVRQLKESALFFDWVGPYFDLLNEQRRREPELAGPSAAWHRRHGRNYPLFQSERELDLLRAPARVLCAVNSNAIGLVEGLTSYVLGTGITYRATPKKGREKEVPPELIDAINVGLFAEFDDRTEWYGGEQPGLEEELFFRSCEDGEFILCHYALDDGRTDVRTVEPEQLTAPPRLPDGDTYEQWTFGVRTEEDDVQCPLAYWIYFGDDPSDGEEYTPDEITHFRRNTKRSIKRGLTDFSFDTLDHLNMACRLLGNLGEGAAQQAAIVGVRQHETGTEEEVQEFAGNNLEDYEEREPLTGQTRKVRRYRKGDWEDIPKGLQYVDGPGAQNAPAHLQVLAALYRAGGRRWNSPEWLCSGDASNTVFASSLTAENPFVKTVTRRQRSYKEAFKRTRWVVIKNHCTKHGGVLAKGRVFTWEDIRQLVDIVAEAPSAEARNKLQEAQQAAIEIPLGVDSRPRYTNSQGRDWDLITADNEQYLQETGGTGQALPLTDDTGTGGPQQATGQQGGELRGTVGGLQAISSMQQAFYEGQIPRAAAVAAMRILFGFTAPQAEALFPAVEPVKRTDQSAGGLGGLPAMEGIDDVTLTKGLRELLEARAGLVKKTITDKNGVKRTVWVKPTEQAPTEREPAEKPQAKEKPAPKARPTIDDTVAHVEGLRKEFTIDGLGELAERLQGHTVAELGEIKKRLGLKASGPKAELARKIAQRALADAEGAKVEPPAEKPAAKAKAKKEPKAAAEPAAPAPKAPAKPAAELKPGESVERTDDKSGVTWAKNKAGERRTVIDPDHAAAQAQRLGPALQKAAEESGLLVDAQEGRSEVGTFVRNALRHAPPGTTANDVLHALSHLKGNRAVDMYAKNAQVGDAAPSEILWENGRPYGYVDVSKPEVFASGGAGADSRPARVTGWLKKSKKSPPQNEREARALIADAEKRRPDLEKMSREELAQALEGHGEKPGKSETKKALVDRIVSRLAGPGRVWLEIQQ